MRQSLGVKNRADLELRMQSPSPLQEVPIAQVHPAQRVQLQGEEWTRKHPTVFSLRNSCRTSLVTRLVTLTLNRAPLNFAKLPSKCGNVHRVQMAGPGTYS